MRACPRVEDSPRTVAAHGFLPIRRSSPTSQASARNAKQVFFPLTIHKLADQRADLIGLRIECEVACVQNVDLRLRHVLTVPFWLAGIEREIMLAPDN